jgi:hypothetical protein
MEWIISHIQSTITRRQFIKAGIALLGSRFIFSQPAELGLPSSTISGGADGTNTLYLPIIQSHRADILVGPTRTYQVPSAAAAVAKDGNTIEIDAGDYIGDTATWQQNNLTIRGVGGKAHLDANGHNAGGKAIWVIQGNNTTLENIEFSGATVPDQNGAGIRQEGSNLTVRSCSFHNNEEGILAGDNPNSHILIEYSELGYNGFGDGYTHNLYINHVASFTMQYCYSHHAIVGHLVKSRALENYLLYNRIMDEADGTSSYSIDLPNGGLSYVIGNLVQQGPYTENNGIVTYAEEGAVNPKQELYLVNNTIVNDHPSGGSTFLRVVGMPAGLVRNNLLVGNGTPVDGTILSDHNVQDLVGLMISRSGYDYHLVAGSPAIDAGTDPGSANGITLTPGWEYMHPTNRETRLITGAIDVGAYEYHP